MTQAEIREVFDDVTRCAEEDAATLPAAAAWLALAQEERERRFDEWLVPRWLAQGQPRRGGEGYGAWVACLRAVWRSMAAGTGAGA